jgi:effector-binding domain-containing protein
MLMLKRAEASQAMQAEGERLMRIEARLQLIELEGKMSNYEVILKNVPAERVAGVKGLVPSFEGNENGIPVIGESFGKAAAFVQKNGARPGTATAVYHWSETMTNVPFEATYGIGDARLDSGDGVEVYALPDAVMVSTVHNGTFVHMNQAYEALMKWIEANGYRICGPSREISHVYEQNDQAKNVTEIQLPVEKA